jgi:hypothetical protein
MGSATELDYHLLLARDLGLLSDANYESLSVDAAELQKMLASFIVRLRDGTNDYKVSDERAYWLDVRSNGQ